MKRSLPVIPHQERQTIYTRSDRRLNGERIIRNRVVKNKTEAGIAVMARRYNEIKGLAEFTARMIVSDEEQL